MRLQHAGQRQRGIQQTDIVTAAGTDDDGNTLQAQDSATVTVWMWLPA
jgi:hypothetical protein